MKVPKYAVINGKKTRVSYIILTLDAMGLGDVPCYDLTEMSADDSKQFGSCMVQMRLNARRVR